VTHVHGNNKDPGGFAMDRPGGLSYIHWRKARHRMTTFMELSVDRPGGLSYRVSNLGARPRAMARIVS
jgi:hypothetical protein